MSRKKAVALAVLIVLAAVSAIGIFTDFLSLDPENMFADLFAGTDLNTYFSGITTAVILGTCFLAAAAILSAVYYYRA